MRVRVRETGASKQVRETGASKRVRRTGASKRVRETGTGNGRRLQVTQTVESERLFANRNGTVATGNEYSADSE